MGRAARRTVLLVAVAALAFALLPQVGARTKAGQSPDHEPLPSLREARVVPIDGTAEEWRLVCRERPAPICHQRSVADAITCPCEGIAYGEVGRLDLQRWRAGRLTDSLALGPLYGSL